MPHRVSLIVEDEACVRQYIATILHREEFETLEAEDGVRGLELVRKWGDRVDLIVSDIQMPNCDGVSFARKVKEIFPALPIILVSGNTPPDEEFDGFVQKPFQPNTLVEAIRHAAQGKLNATL